MATVSIVKLVRLETWLTQTYGDDKPTLATARRWCKAGKIYPAPQKQGSAYFLHPDARYNPGSPTLVDRLRADEAKALAH